MILHPWNETEEVLHIFVEEFDNLQNLIAFRQQKWICMTNMYVYANHSNETSELIFKSQEIVLTIFHSKQYPADDF